MGLSITRSSASLGKWYLVSPIFLWYQGRWRVVNLRRFGTCSSRCSCSKRHCRKERQHRWRPSHLKSVPRNTSINVDVQEWGISIHPGSSPPWAGGLQGLRQRSLQGTTSWGPSSWLVISICKCCLILELWKCSMWFLEDALKSSIIGRHQPLYILLERPLSQHGLSWWSWTNPPSLTRPW